jgi:hypothetical protein
LLDTESFMEAIQPSLASEEIIAALGDTISEQALVALDIESRLATGLDAIDAYLAETLADTFDLSSRQRALLAQADLPRLGGLATPLAAPLEGRIEQAVDDLVISDGFRETLPAAIASAHRGIVGLMTEDIDDLENVTVADGEVRWDILPPVIGAVGYIIDEGILGSPFESLELADATHVGLREDTVAWLGEALDTVLPEDFAQVTLMSEDQLQGWQSTARTINGTAILAVLLTVVLMMGALVLSRNRRRTLVQLAAGSGVAVLITGIVQHNVVGTVIAAIPGQSPRAAVDILFAAVVANLRVTFWVYVVAAGVIGLSAHLAGRPRWLQSLGAKHRPDSRLGVTIARLNGIVRDHNDAFLGGGVGLALMVWWRVGINLASLVIIGLLLAAYLWGVSRLLNRSDLLDTARL